MSRSSEIFIEQRSLENIAVEEEKRYVDRMNNFWQQENEKDNPHPLTMIKNGCTLNQSEISKAVLKAVSIDEPITDK